MIVAALLLSALAADPDPGPPRAELQSCVDEAIKGGALPEERR